MNKLKNYKKIITDDDSTTYFSKLYGETCHSTAGAASETRTHYIEGCSITQKLNTQDTINIFEVGFGTGLGFTQTLDSVKGLKKHFTFVSTEIDTDFIEGMLEQMGFNINKKETNKLTYYSVYEEYYSLIILAGDARETIKKLPSIFNEKFHAVYQDAFSPKRNAILWTKEWFDDLRKICSEDAILSTYSASSSIRKSLIAAGWTVFNGVEFGKKRSSTRAKLTGTTSDAIIDQLNRSPAPLLTDDNYKNYTLGNI